MFSRIPLDGSLRQVWEEADLDFKRDLMKLLVKKGVVRPGRTLRLCKINDQTFRFDPSLMQIIGKSRDYHPSYGNQPKVGASADTLVSFYDGHRPPILTATVIFGFAVLNLTAALTHPGDGLFHRRPRWITLQAAMVI